MHSFTREEKTWPMLGRTTLKPAMFLRKCKGRGFIFTFLWTQPNCLVTRESQFDKLRGLGKIAIVWTIKWAGQLSRYSDWLRAGLSGDRIPMGARFSAPVQTGSGNHPAFCIMGTGSFPGVKNGRDVMLPPHPLLVPWSWKNRAIPLLPLWAVRPVQSLSACTRVQFTYERLNVGGVCCPHLHDTILTLRWLMSYIYGAPILDVSRSHTTTQHSR